MSELTRHSPSDARRRRRRAIVALPIGALIFLALGWSTFWLLARNKADAALTDWIAREESAGRRWSCGDRQIGGYPLVIDIRCELLAFSGDLAGAPTFARMRRVSIVAPLTAPRRINVEATGPLEVERNHGRLELDWSQLKIYVRGLPERVERMTLASEAVRFAFGDDARAWRGTIARVHSHFRREAGAPGAASTIESGFAGLESPDLDRLAGDTAPAQVASVISTSQFDKLTRGALAERLELWRQAGGRLHLGLIAIQKGEAAIQADGGLGLDQSHRLDGKIDVRLRQAGRIALNAGVNAGVLREGAMTTQLLAAFLQRAGANGETRLDLSFANGALGVGPLKNIFVLPPLY